jgi:hypothetical protein
MFEIIVAIITLAGSYGITRLTLVANQKKTDAEIEQIYTRLGIDKNKAQADNANTWMDVAKKAADEYERVMAENVGLRKKVVSQDKKIASLQMRVRVLEAKKRKN